MPNLTDADKVLRNDTGKDIVTKLDGILNAIEGTKQSLENLSDVNVSNPSDNQALLFNAQSSKWKNTSLGGAAFKNVDTAITSGSSNPVSSDAVNTGLSDKADKSNTYTKSEVNDIASAKADTDSVYTKSETYTKEEVNTLISNLPEPMIFKGTLGVNGTITELPTASASNEGYTYKVITEGTYAGTSAKVGDVFVSAKPEGASAYSWVLIPAGDEDSDTWRAIKVNGVEKLGNAISSGSVDFVDTTNVKFEFDSNGNAVKATLSGIDTSSEVDAKVAGLIDDTSTVNDKAWSSQKITDELIALLPVDSASGSIASFSTSLALPLVSLKASIVATESGSGTKSPTNPYTLGGFSNAVIYQGGANLWDEQVLNGYLSSTDGSFIAHATSICSKNFCKCNAGEAVYIKSSTSSTLYIVWFDENKNFISRVVSNNAEKTAPNNARYFKVSCYNYGTAYNNDISVNYPSTDTTYHAYTATQTTLALGQTVYGGEIVLTKQQSGYGVKLRVYPHYPSYNGETLTGKWQSSMDNYVAGTTPTIGADVVDLSGAVYTEIDLTDESDIVALVGTNNVWSDTGDMEVSYKKKQTD